MIDDKLLVQLARMMDGTDGSILLAPAAIIRKLQAEGKILAQPGDLIGEKEAAEILGVAEATLRNWRALKQGPKTVKLGKRMIRYRRADLAAFIDGEEVQDK